MRRRPPRRRVGRRDELGVTSLAAPNAASSRTARYSSTARPAGSCRQTGGTLDAVADAGVGLKQTGVAQRANTGGGPTGQRAHPKSTTHSNNSVPPGRLWCITGICFRPITTTLLRLLNFASPIFRG